MEFVPEFEAVIRQFGGRMSSVCFAADVNQTQVANGIDRGRPVPMLRKLFPCTANSIKRPFD